MMEMRLIFMALICLFIAQLAFAANYNYAFQTPQAEQRYTSLIKQIRCSVCQTQSLFESDTAQAAIMRQQIYDMLASGKDPQQIKALLRAQYGDQILFMPPWRSSTLVLWLGPIVMLSIAAALLVKRRLAAKQELNYAC